MSIIYKPLNIVGRMLKRVSKFLFITLIIIFYSLEVFAVEKNLSDEVDDKKMTEDDRGKVKKIAEDTKGILSIVLENDLFAKTDLGYTNGIRLSYTSSERQMPLLIRRASDYLPLLNNEGKKRVSVALGQNMYTPSDIKKSEFLQDDFLYAGWLYGSLGIVSDSGTTYDNAALSLGVVGPSAKAEPTQKFVHHIVGSPQPQGWKHQLKDEPGINFAYERKWRKILEVKPFGVGVDMVPHLGGNLGNINTSAAVGATFRIGYDLPSDYGPPRIRPSLPGSDFFIPTKRIGGYLFSVLEMRAVGRNIFIDGNSFKNSPSLEKRTMVKSLQLGAAATFKDVRISYTHVFVTKEFKGQDKGTRFGAITVSVRF